MSHKGWIGVDLDGTLAEYDGWRGPNHIGRPIPVMVARVKEWLSQGVDVRIFTARVYPLGFVPATEKVYAPHSRIGDYETDTAYVALLAIREWCREQFDCYLPVTCIKDYGMYELWDDRAIQVVRNTGQQVGVEPQGETTP